MAKCLRHMQLALKPPQAQMVRQQVHHTLSRLHAQREEGW